MKAMMHTCDVQPATVADVANRYGFSQRTVRDLAKRGQLPCVRWGRQWRFDLGTLDALMRGEVPR